jgi:Zn-dependent membrane protease YugP
MTGAQIARRILDANGLNEVPVEETPGSLSDHYDPRSRSVHLSEPVFRGVSVASTAVGAHEVGHAIQHAQAYAFFRFRSAMFPAVQFASNIWMLFLLGGIFLNILGFIYVAIALYSVAVLFQFVTLPVEFDASSRAKRQLSDLGLVASNEATGVQATLKAAAWTYVAAALAAVAVLLYYLSMLATASAALAGHPAEAPQGDDHPRGPTPGRSLGLSDRRRTNRRRGRPRRRCR